MIRRSLAALAFPLALVVNPAFLFAGCGFRFGEKEAIALVDAAGAHRTYRFTSDAETFEATLDLTQATRPTELTRATPLVRSARACGNRTFVKSAAACLDVTTVPVEGKVHLARVLPTAGPVVERSVRGNVEIFGTSLRRASLFLFTPERDTFDLGSDDARTFALSAVSFSPAAGEKRVTYRRP